MKEKPEKQPQQNQRPQEKTVIPFPQKAAHPPREDLDMETLIRHQMSLRWPIDWNERE